MRRNGIHVIFALDVQRNYSFSVITMDLFLMLVNNLLIPYMDNMQIISDGSDRAG